MRRAAVAEVMCLSCGRESWGVVLAADSSPDKPDLIELCVECLDEMAHVSKLLQLRMRPPATFKADYGPEWTRIHDAILERDGHQCQDDEHQAVGGANLGESLVVHHIKPLKKFADYLSGNQPENLITLCSLCHSRWHGRLRRAKVHG